jgi:hypothetical protein
MVCNILGKTETDILNTGVSHCSVQLQYSIHSVTRIQDSIDHGCGNFLWHRTTPIIVGRFTGRMLTTIYGTPNQLNV